MDTEQLAAFERIVSEGGFGRAAWSLGISQPAISARMRALEREVGGPLFTRGGRKGSLTALGESFLPYARRALALMSEGVEAARATQEGHRGRVTLGTLESLAAGFLAPAVARFHAAQPAVDLVVRSGDHRSVVDMFRDGVTELALVTWPAEDLPGADPEPLLRFREPLVPVTGAGHPLAGSQVKLQEFVRRACPFLLLGWDPHIREVQVQAMEGDEGVLDLAIHTARALLLLGVGGAIMTRTLVGDDLATGRLVEVVVTDAPPLFRDSALFGIAGREPSPAALRFVAALREEAGALRPQRAR